MLLGTSKMGAEIIQESLIKFLAGLLDADGSLSFSFRRFGEVNYIGLVLSLASSDAVDKQGFVSSLPDLTKMGAVYRDGEKSQFVYWRVFKHSDLERLLPRLIKHMVIKPRHWQWMLDVWREKRGIKLSDTEREVLTEASKKSRIARVGPIKPKNHPTWAWLAGYLDGDGTYHYRQCKRRDGYRRFEIAVSAVAHVNDRFVLDFIHSAFGGKIWDHGQSDNVLVWRRSLGYQNRSFSERFLPNLAKHSRLKRERIDAILNHHRQRLSVPGSDRRYCEVSGCDRPRHGHGLCYMHYMRERGKRQSKRSTLRLIEKRPSKGSNSACPIFEPQYAPKR